MVVLHLFTIFVFQADRFSQISSLGQQQLLKQIYQSTHSLILFQEFQKKTMMKQYDFPCIFQNIVGEVISIPKNRQSQIKHFSLGTPQVESSKSRFILKEQDSKGKLTLISTKKQIVRRMKFNKTLGCVSLRKYVSQEDKSSQNDNESYFKHYLKRKPDTVQRTQRTYKFGPSIQRNSVFQQSPKDQDEIISHFGKVSSKDTSKRHVNSIRLRTSIEQSTKFDIERAIQELARKTSKRSSQINTNMYIKETLPPRPKIKHKTFFNYESNKKDNSQIQEESEHRSSQRKMTKKKTVNFTVQHEEKQNSEHKNTNKKGSKTNNHQKQSKFNLNSNKKATSRQLSKTDLLNQSSQWSAKTVISIKFDSNCQINSKKSLRSQQSILLGSNNNFIKKSKNNRYGTRTFLKFNQNEQITQRKYKSLKSISQISIKTRSQKSIKRSKSKNRPINKTLLTSINVKKILKEQNQNKAASILVKASQPYLITDSIKSIERRSTFQDLVFKKSAKILPKGLRQSTQADIFLQLNNFHKFLNENDGQQNDQDLQKTLTKPLILNSQTLIRTSLNPQIQKRQNFIIDMSLNLIKKMNILKQKKL